MIPKPKPASVRYNNWRSVAVEPLDAFAPLMPVSVIIPYYQTPAETLERTLAALEGQTYPRDLFEVVIVDDGSDPPLERPSSTPLDVRVVRQERRGFGIARARNTGARAAAHDILLFIDSDCLAEAEWIAAHARWHHAVSDALTFGARSHVSEYGIDADAIRRRRGSLEELFSSHPTAPGDAGTWMVMSNYLESKTEDIFRGIMGGNFGIRKDFYWSAGGHDESFARWGAEDTEFSYRAYILGGLLAPARDALMWHQGISSEEDDGDSKRRSERLQRGKVAHLIAHPSFRGSSPGRIFAVPRHVVSIEDSRRRSPDEVVRAVVDILADREHDLAVRIETPARGGEWRLQYLCEAFGPDPRVRVAPARSALDEFPASPFHIAIPAGVAFRRGLVHRMRAALGSAVVATATLPDGSAVSITRAWALNRARRAGGVPADFGDAKTIPAAKLKLALSRHTKTADSAELEGYPAKRDIVFDRVRDTRSPAEAWSLLRWMAGVLRWRAVVKQLVVSWRIQRMARDRLSARGRRSGARRERRDVGR